MPVKNNYKQKLKRTLTSVLPVAKNRRGECKNCGACCYLPKKCIFLKMKDGKSYCSVYKFRSLNCRKYPRTEKECLTKDTCGYRFE
jgi:Fe-S-cluster containining protein